jgi:predicted dehydrogenase
MRFALCGDEPAGLAVARAVAIHSDHELTHQVGRPTLRSGILTFGPSVRYCPTWEELLVDPTVDAVIVSGWGKETEQAVRQLVQAGKAVLVPPALVQPASFFYELALLEAERPAKLFPLLGLRGHPLILKLRDLISGNSLGRLRHAQLDRQIASESGNPVPLFTETDLTRALLCDADLLRSLCGAYDQVTASRSGNPQQGYSLATVTLAGTAVPQAIWTASATSGQHDWRLTVTGESGTAVLEGDPDRAAFRLTLALRGQPPITEAAVDDAGSWLLAAFAASFADADSTEFPAARPARPGSLLLTERDTSLHGEGTNPHTDGSLSLWGELARAIELVDAVERSVRRRRTIDVYFDTPSERGIFKTQMTAVGCSLLVLTLGAAVIYLALAAMVELPPFLKKLLVVLIFVPLGVFLTMQLLFFVARPATRDGR